jgi:glycosyltransferase involved in cell wall biosynthesis
VRAAAVALGLDVVLLGSDVEGPDFWAGINTIKKGRADEWLDGVLAVVQPALVEDRPTALLTALASGCPVIATEACGLPDVEGLTIVPSGDVEALVGAIRAL